MSLQQPLTKKELLTIAHHLGFTLLTLSRNKSTSWLQLFTHIPIHRASLMNQKSFFT